MSNCSAKKNNARWFSTDTRWRLQKQIASTPDDDQRWRHTHSNISIIRNNLGEFSLIWLCNIQYILCDFLLLVKPLKCRFFRLAESPNTILSIFYAVIISFVTNLYQDMYFKIATFAVFFCDLQFCNFNLSYIFMYKTHLILSPHHSAINTIQRRLLLLS